jgi:hypothetical protein
MLLPADGFWQEWVIAVQIDLGAWLKWEMLP